MTAELHQLVTEVIELTGAATPTLLEKDAPVLHPATVEADPEQPYLVGLLGGKEVGKSALVNAVSGKRLSPASAFGPGTEIAVAYAHKAQAEPVRHLLETEAPGRFRIIGHDMEQLSRQVLLDLPDIDSHFSEHVELTR